MGLFGRDESPIQKPAASTPVPSRSTAAQQTSSDTTIIARSCRIEGSLSGPGDINIQGRFKGEIDGTGELLVSESGNAEARLHARTIVVAGSVKGDVSADEKIELKPTANLLGNITAPRILIQEGATFEGQVYMKKPSELKAVAAKAGGGATGGSATSGTAAGDSGKGAEDTTDQDKPDSGKADQNKGPKKK